jgi:hypothetical protein
VTNSLKIDYTTDLIDSRLISGIITVDKRQFEMTVDLEDASLSCRSLDGKPIPLQALWSGYQRIHAEAVSRRTGRPNASWNPEEQIGELGDRDTADRKIAGSSVPPSSVFESGDEGDDQESGR